MDFEIVQTTEEATVVVLDEQPTEIISEGMMGPPGPPGDGLVGNLPVVFFNLQPGDVLSFGGDKIINTPAASLTDGGNF